MVCSHSYFVYFVRISREEGPVNVVRDDRDYKPNEQSQNSSLKSSGSWTEKSHKVMESNSQESNTPNEGYGVRDVEIAQEHNCQEAKADGSENPLEENEYSLTDDLDLQTWEPPEPENPQDDVDHSVACNDDDDEGVDSMSWGEPTSLSRSKDEVSQNYRFKEEKLRAMEEVISGKFKAHVGQLLKSMGVSSSNEGGKSWVDIVTSLSWEAASFLKLDAIGDSSMNPDRYVKVKCIAAGSCSQR